MVLSCARWFVPEAEMSGDAIEVLVEPVAGENGQTVGSKTLPDLMEELVRIGRRTTADMKSEDEFALGGDCSPDPDAFGILFYFGYQFIKLQMADGQSPVE